MESLTVTANGCAPASRKLRSSAAAQLLGAAGIAGVTAASLLMAAGAADAPGRYVPARSGGWPSWLSGPFAGLHMQLGSSAFQTLTLLMCASYALVLVGARTLPTWALAGAIGVSFGAFLLGPPLISQDVLGYVGFARLGALHGLDPYTHAVAEAPNDPVLPFIGWPLQSSPYGPLFTLGSYALVPLGVAGNLWAFKALAALAALATVALTALAAQREGASGRAAAAFVGLNPVMLSLALGGAHNDLLVLALLAGALALSARAPAGAGARAREPMRANADMPAGAASPWRRRGAAVLLVADVAIKASSGLLLPFVVLSPRRWRERAWLAGSAAAALAVLALLALAGFGQHALGFLGVLHDQQQLVATHSVPAETARWIGLHGLPSWWRDGFLVAFLAAGAIALWRTAQGADWRAMAGWATLALLLSTAWLLPWYAVWLLPLAAVSHSRRLRVATLLFCAYAILIHLPLAAPALSPTG